MIICLIFYKKGVILLEYCNLEKGIKHSIYSSMKKTIIDFLEANDWDLNKIDIEFHFKSWLNSSKYNTNFSWYERLPDDLDINLINDLKKLFKEKIYKIYNKSTSEESINYIINLSKKLDIDINKEKIKYYGYHKNQIIKLKKLNTLATQKQLRFGNQLYEELYKEKLPQKEYTKKEMSRIIELCLNEKNRRIAKKNNKTFINKCNFSFNNMLDETYLQWLYKMAIKYDFHVYKSIEIFLRNLNLDNLKTLSEKESFEFCKNQTQNYIDKYKEDKNFIKEENSEELLTYITQLTFFILRNKLK